MKRPRLEVYPDHAGEHRWRLKAANGQIIADSAEGYTTPHGARRAARTLLRTVALLLKTA